MKPGGSDTGSLPDDSQDVDNETHNPSHTRDLGAEAAGVVRGLSRSFGRSIAQSPIGRLPKSMPKAFKPSTARQIAKMSDRVSTGMTWYGAYEESSQTAVAKQNAWIRQGRAFAVSLAKNSFLGSLVFEAYAHVVTLSVSGRDPDEIDNILDDYAKASVPLHFTAGLAAGAIQGVAVSSPAFWEAAKAHRNIGYRASPIHTPAYAARFFTLNSLNHCLAHSMLFGSYQGTKRILERALLDESTPSFGVGYLFCFTMAGGLAGQIQHLFSHYSEQIFGLSESELMVAPSLIFRGFVHPTLRSTLMAFPSSAIGFIAFEYGKEFL